MRRRADEVGRDSWSSASRARCPDRPITRSRRADRRPRRRTAPQRRDGAAEEHGQRVADQRASAANDARAHALLVRRRRHGVPADDRGRELQRAAREPDQYAVSTESGDDRATASGHRRPSPARRGRVGARRAAGCSSSRCSSRAPANVVADQDAAAPPGWSRRRSSGAAGALAGTMRARHPRGRTHVASPWGSRRSPRRAAGRGRSRRTSNAIRLDRPRSAMPLARSSEQARSAPAPAQHRHRARRSRSASQVPRHRRRRRAAPSVSPTVS